MPVSTFSFCSLSFVPDFTAPPSVAELRTSSTRLEDTAALGIIINIIINIKKLVIMRIEYCIIAFMFAISVIFVTVFAPTHKIISTVILNKKLTVGIVNAI